MADEIEGEDISMKFYNVVFSPTGGTKKAADSLLKGLNENADIDNMK